MPTDTQIEAILKQRIDREKQSPGIVVGIIDPNGQRIISYGTLSATNADRVDGNTLFEIGSITKVFTALALVQLSEQKVLNLDDPIAKFLPPTVKAPEFNGKAITLLTLATHTSSLPRLPDNLAPADDQNPYADYTVDQLYSFLSSYKLPREIGTKYEYSNLGAGLLGHLLSSKVGLDYETLIANQITQPLRMQDTRIRLTPDQTRRFATGHDQRNRAVPHWDLPSLAGAGALRSSANDLLKFLAANLDLQPSPINASLQKTHALQQHTDSPKRAIALGWHLRTEKGPEIIFHNGGTGGFRSFIGFSNKQRLGVVVLGNSESDVSDLGFHLLDSRSPLAKYQPPKAAIAIDPKVLATYVGNYELTPEFSIAITQDQDRLYLQATGQSKVELFAETPTHFFLTVVEAKITFIKDDQGKIDRLILDQNGQRLPGKKNK
ncbi:MAG: serine hydrolase [Alkalinema sp. RU_4_3]|nr:serine hydrolase [Alkalinema sp. RU_4_3]